MRRIFALIIVASLGTTVAYAQERLVVESWCSFDGADLEDDVYTFQTDQQAWTAIQKILAFTGLEPNFKIRAGNVPNAMAVINAPERMIIYNQQFMLQVASIDPDWAATSILAHELAHHLQGHTLRPGGSRPELELQADKWSGFILQQMGATLEQAQAAMQQLGTPQNTATHPGKSARLAAISNGWIQAQELQSKQPGEPSKEPVPQDPEERRSRRTVPDVGPTTPEFVARIVFNNNPNAFYLAPTNEILMITPTGQRTIAGSRIPPTVPGFAWMIFDSGTGGTYGVTPAGEIINRDMWGNVFQVGYVTSPN